VTIQLSKQYDIKGIDGMTLHTILTALADAQRMYAKAGMTGMAENAKNAHQTILDQTKEYSL